MMSSCWLFSFFCDYYRYNQRIVKVGTREDDSPGSCELPFSAKKKSLVGGTKIWSCELLV